MMLQSSSDDEEKEEYHPTYGKKASTKKSKGKWLLNIIVSSKQGRRFGIL